MGERTLMTQSICVAGGKLRLREVQGVKSKARVGLLNMDLIKEWAVSWWTLHWLLIVTGSYDPIYMRHRGVKEGERWKGN